MRQIQAGDQAAFNRLVQTWHKQIYNFAWKYFSQQLSGEHQNDLASEICQKTFIKVYEKINSLEDPRKFKPWLYRIASNMCLEEDRRRKQGRFLRIGNWTDWDQLLNGRQHTDAEAIYQETNMVNWALKAIQSLKPEYRIILLMKEYEGFTFKEIAESLEISENTVKTRLYAGLRKVRQQLALWKIEM